MNAEFNNPIEACKWAIKNFNGDIVEIGAGLGETTKHLLKIANGQNRKVIVIDPFDNGWGDMPVSYGKPYPISAFFNNLEKSEVNTEAMDLWQINSLSEQAEKITMREIAFAFVDGLQYKRAVLSDLKLIGHASVICVDDIDRETGESQVPSAIRAYMENYGQNKQLIINNRWAFILTK